MTRWVYTQLMRLALPVVLVAMGWRGWRSADYRIDLMARLGLRYPASAARPVWVHAVSVGEVQASSSLIRQLLQQVPARPLLLTMATATAMARARTLFGDLLLARSGRPPLAICYAPFDLPGAARRFLNHHAPTAALFLETELWPNLIACAAATGIPVALISARVSARSARRYRQFLPGLMRETLQHFGLIAVQSEVDAERFRLLGAKPEAVHTMGNIKFDFVLPEGLIDRAKVLREQMGSARPVWVAGSTHAGEEAQCLDAHLALCERAKVRGQPTPLMVMVPRHPERFESVARWLSSAGVQFARFSTQDAITRETRVLLVDSVGELLAFYAAGDAAFVGGSLIPVGGHNLLEPAALARPTIAGPHTFNAPEAAQLLELAEALIRVSDADSLAQALAAVMLDPAVAKARGLRAQHAVNANRGATARAMALLEPLLLADSIKLQSGAKP
jgi:3-deoxy-D-manno-octulosonic-acid transferase